jgi:hypothetical protein
VEGSPSEAASPGAVGQPVVKYTHINTHAYTHTYTLIQF